MLHPNEQAVLDQAENTGFNDGPRTIYLWQGELFIRSANNLERYAGESSDKILETLVSEGKSQQLLCHLPSF